MVWTNQIQPPTYISAYELSHIIRRNRPRLSHLLSISFGHPALLVAYLDEKVSLGMSHDKSGKTHVSPVTFAEAPQIEAKK